MDSKDQLSNKEKYSKEKFEQILSKGKDVQIDPDQHYKVKWDMEAETHQIIMTTLRTIMDDEFSNFVVGDAIVFYDQLKNVSPVNNRVSKEVICSGLSITALTIILYEIWKDEEMLSHKKDFNEFIDGFYDRIEPE